MIRDGKPVCPHCTAIDGHYYIRPLNGTSRRTRTGSASQRRVWKCHACRKQFSVLTGTIFHGSKVPVRTWLFVVFEMCASKNGVCAREIERKYDLTPKTAWFMLDRIRLAMQTGTFEKLSGHVEVDETFTGGKARFMHKDKRRSKIKGTGSMGKVAVMGLLERHGEFQYRIMRISLNPITRFGVFDHPSVRASGNGVPVISSSRLTAVWYDTSSSK